ncbi:serpin (serine protease inhibitor) domain-containing protein [Ditylenchus destructor]|nr:serpin (serine protease inhibitor) domain-containing protein [Ditylenchus destructor]
MTLIQTARRWLRRFRNRFGSRTGGKSKNDEENSEDDEVEDSAENPSINCKHKAEIETKNEPERLKNRAMIEASNDFATRLMKEFLGSESVCISPISISFVLAMSLVGAKGETEAEILKLLGKGCTLEEVELFFLEIKTIFQQLSYLEILCDANRIYYDLSIELLETYKEKVTRLYGKDAFDLSDFGDSDGAAKKINSFVEETTKGNLRDVITGDEIRGSRIKMIMLNAIDFQGKWRSEFNPRENMLMKFHLLNGTSKKTEMMTTRYESASYYFYCENDEMQRICLPYKIGYRERDVGEISMYIFLPRTRKGLPRLIENLNGEKLLKWLRMKPLENYRRRLPTVCDIQYKVTMSIPKFTIRSDIKLKDTLEKIGLRHYFTCDADFSGASDDPLHGTNFIHKTYIKTDECGTEASVHSIGSHVYCMSGPIIPRKDIHKEFHADHPFLYAIVSRKQHVLFIGTVMDVDEKDEAEFEEWKKKIVDDYYARR